MDIEQLKELLQAGKSHREIADLLGVSKSTIGYYIKKYELEEYSKNHAPRHAIQWGVIDTPEKAYTLGFILADGFISPKNDVHVSVSKRDRSIIEYIATQLNSELLINNTFNKKQRHFPYVATSRRIKDITKFTGGRLKQDRHYPRVKQGLERFLLLGFFDGDGCVTYGIRKDRNRLWYKLSFTSQYKLLEGVQSMLYNNLGISSKIRPKSGENCYVLEISSKSSVLSLINYLYPKDDNFIVLYRKYSKCCALRLELEEIGGVTQ